jgi:hypothetical protein
MGYNSNRARLAGACYPDNMVRDRGWELCVLLALPLACTALDDENAMPFSPGFAGAAGTPFGAAGKGASTASAAGSGAAGKTSNVDTEAGGAGGVTSLAGAAGDVAGGTTSLAGGGAGGVTSQGGNAGGGVGGDTSISGTGGGGTGVTPGAGGAVGPGAGGGNTGGQTWIGSTAGSGGAGPLEPGECSGDGSLVCVAINDAWAAFYDAQGSVTDMGKTPREHAVSEGGMVTVINGGTLTSYVSVPAGTTIRHDQGHFLPTSPIVQSIKITVPQYGSVSVDKTSIRTSCGGPGAPNNIKPTFGVAQELTMREDCLVSGEAELFIVARGQTTGVIHVPHIALGDRKLAAKEIVLPEWQEELWSGSFALTHTPWPINGQVAFHTYWGAREMDNLTFSSVVNGGGNATFKLSLLLPDVGQQWWRSVQVYDASGQAQTERSQIWEKIGALTSSQTLEYSDLLSPPDVTLAGPEITVGGITDPKIDRVLTTVTYAFGAPIKSWRIWSPPDATQIRLPTGPAEVAELSGAAVTNVVVRVEDAAEIDGYAQAFEYFSRDQDVDATDLSLSRAHPHRFALRKVVP